MSKLIRTHILQFMQPHIMLKQGYKESYLLLIPSLWNSTRGRRQCQKCRYRWWQAVGMAATRSSRVTGGLEPTSIWIRWEAEKHPVHHMKHTVYSQLWILLEYSVHPDVFGRWEKNSENSTSKGPKSKTKSRTFNININPETHTTQVFLFTHDVTTFSMQRHSLI